MRARGVVLGVFFVSGLSALLYQISWLKYLGLVFGNTVHAAATLIAIFLAGLGIGGYLFGRFFHRVRPLVLYAVLEAVIGAIGAFSSNAFELLDRLYVTAHPSIGDQPLLLTLFRIGAASLFLLPPTVLMGGTLPVLVRFFSGERLASGRAVSSLYAANTFGATAGVALAGFWLIPTVGLTATIGIAVALNFGLAAFSTFLAWTSRSNLPVEPPSLEESSAGPIAAWAAVVAAFFMGLSSIADEVFWSRILVLHLGSSVYAYALMLFCFLIGLAIGSALVYRIIERARLERLLAILELALAAALAAQIHYFTRFADVLEAIARTVGASGQFGTLVTLLVAVLSALLIPTVLMGATFPVVVKIYSLAAERSEARSVGVIYFANTLGSIAGSLLAGFVLIRLLGSQNGLFLMAAINLVIGLWFLVRGRERGAAALATAAAAVGAVGLSFVLARPDQVILSAGLFVDARAPVLLFREDVSATVTLRRLGPEVLSLELNGVNVAGTSPELIGTQKLQGHLPLLIHPEPKKVLHIGFGSGGTAWAVSRHPVEEIVVAEISPEVIEVSSSMLREVNNGVLDDPRVRVEINDGRNFVLASRESFDVLLSDSIHPRYAGNGSLYTKDYFELCRERLSPDGVISMWLPMYSLTERNYLMILRAFRDVFPDASIWYVPNVSNSFTIILGRLEQGPIPLDRVAARLEGEIAAELEPIGVENEIDLASMLLVDAAGVAAMTEGVEPHVDDLPAVEYESGRLIDRDLSWLKNFVLLARQMSPLGRAFPGASEDELERAERLRKERISLHIEQLAERIRGERGIE
ncbi:MAG TPA: fused MFS/spermidine synthase [Thermoanaerobaculia bacterium]|nr:fused MFS/spermidine synthase [Thermoanaerobaculia bacterium]